MLNDAGFLARESNNLRLPSEEDNDALGLATWLKYSKLQDNYLAAKARFMKERLQRPEDLTLDRIWDGDGVNDNAALTVFRHFDSASVVKGLIGDAPKTAWVVTYSLLERIHYLLVAGFDVYGNLGHQLNSRLYMDFLRMEGEFNFLILLPEEIRRRERDYWYRGASQEVKDYLFGGRIDFKWQTGIAYTSRDPKAELFAKLRTYLDPELNYDHDFATGRNGFVTEPLQRLAKLKGRALSWLPQTAFLTVTENRAGPHKPLGIFSLLENSAHSNISHLLGDQKMRLPDEDTLSVARGFVGAYPNVFFKVDENQLSDFVTAIQRLQSEPDYQGLLDRFGVRRTHPDFWRHSDALHRAYRQVAPIEAGLFDYNRLENR